MNWLTIVVIVFVIIMVLIGMWRGLVRMLITVAGLFITLFLCSLLRGPVTGFLEDHTGLYRTLENGVATFTEKAISEYGNSGNSAATPQEIIGSLPIPEMIRDSLLSDYNGEQAARSNTGGISSYLVTWLTSLVFMAVAYLICFIIAGILVRIVSFILIHAANLPGIRQVNSLAGALCGFALALLMLWIGSVIVTSFASSSWGQEGLRMIEESPLLSFIYNHNLLLDMLVRYTRK